MRNLERGPRKPRKARNWGICSGTGKVRYGERRDAQLEIRRAFHARAAAHLAGATPTHTIVRAYKCEECRGYHTTSIGYLEYQRRRGRREATA